MRQEPMSDKSDSSTTKVYPFQKAGMYLLFVLRQELFSSCLIEWRKSMDLRAFFRENPRAAIAFSGGVDSAYLLYAAQQYAKDVTAYYVKTDFQPEFEMEDAKRLARETGARMRILSADALCDERVAENPPDRCYYCKQNIFGMILKSAAEDGYTMVLDGTNASDDAGDRPGMRALRELSVRSPLRECGLTKAKIRELSKEAGLFTWDKPSYACLATRVPAGTRITTEILKKTEAAETFLAGLGLRDFRVRYLDGAARLQVPASSLGTVLEHREQILSELGKDYKAVLLDLVTR